MSIQNWQGHRGCTVSGGEGGCIYRYRTDMEYTADQQLKAHIPSPSPPPPLHIPHRLLTLIQRSSPQHIMIASAICNRNSHPQASLPSQKSPQNELPSTSTHTHRCSPQSPPHPTSAQPLQYDHRPHTQRSTQHRLHPGQLQRSALSSAPQYESTLEIRVWGL